MVDQTSPFSMIVQLKNTAIFLSFVKCFPHKNFKRYCSTIFGQTIGGFILSRCRVISGVIASHETQCFVCIILNFD